MTAERGRRSQLDLFGCAGPSAQRSLIGDAGASGPRVGPLDLPGARYVPGFLSSDEQRDLLAQIDARPWASDLSSRRVQHHGYRYDYRARALDPKRDRLGPLPPDLAALADELARAGLFPQVPDQAILNEYLPGQGIGPHVDCVPCFAEHVGTISLGSPVHMEFRHVRTGDVRVADLEVGSVLVLAGEARYAWTHQIRPRAHDLGRPRGRRVSATFRNVVLR